MPRRRLVDNYRVVVYPRSPGDYGIFSISGDPPRTPEKQREICEHLKSKILQHVSKMDDDRGEVHIEADSSDVCSYCGRPWTEESTAYNGGCCAKDEEGKLDAKLS